MIRLSRLIAVAVVFLFGLTLVGQTSGDASPASYRLEFTLHEIQNGKPVSVRTYSMVLATRSRGGLSNGRIRIGGSVPVKTGGDSTADKDQDRYSYKDIGFSLDCTLFQQNPNEPPPAGLSLAVTAAVTTIVPPSQPPLPIFRNASTSVQVTVPVGRRISIAKLEDLASDESYELEVEATPADAAEVTPH